MNLHLKDKTAFVSGSTSGIGFGIAQTLLQEGANVIINGRTTTGVEKAVNQLKLNVPNATVSGIPIDFSKPYSIPDIFKNKPQIDILINNVGIYTSKSFIETSIEDWNNQLQVNLLSGVQLSNFFLEKMLAKNWGRIIFISSECAQLVPKDLIAYSTTKAAIHALSRGLAQLTQGSNITVNTIIPGSTATEGAQQFISELAKTSGKSIKITTSDFFKENRPGSLINRFATVTEIANTVCYYASPLSSATNGASIKIDGGSISGIF